MDGACIDVVLFQRTLLRFLANEDKQAGIKSNINCFFFFVWTGGEEEGLPC